MTHRPTRVLILGRTVVQIWAPDHVRTILPDGAEVPASPQDTDEYRARAAALGYGDDTAAMSRDHEIAHSLLAFLLDLPESPALRAAATDAPPAALTGHEEDAVLAIQAMCREAGIDLLDVATRASLAQRLARL